MVPLQAVDQSHQHKYGAALTEVQTIIAPVQIWMTVHAPTEFPAAVTHVPSTSTQELPNDINQLFLTVLNALSLKLQGKC